MLRSLLAAVAAVGVFSCAPPEPGDGPAPVLFEGARLILGDGGVVERGALLVVADRIEAVGPVGTVAVPEGATRVDLAGKTVTPAFIDAHAHLGYEGYVGWGADHYSRDNLVEHLERYAYYGFGAVFSAGSDPDDLALELQRAQRDGEVGGARFVFAAGMAPPGQGPNNRFLEHALAVSERTGMTVLRGVATPDEARSAVRDVAAKGVPFVKIWVDDRGGTQEKLRPDVYRALAEEARAQGLRVVVHQQATDDMPGLLDAGVWGFLHGRIGASMDEALVNGIRDADAFLVPNLGLGELRSERVSDDPFLREATPDAVVRRLGEAYDARPPVGGDPGAAAAQEQELRDGFASLLAGGVDIVLGTDAGAVPDHFFGYTGHRELEIFVRLGMSPMQALVAATGTAAARLGLDDLGTLAVGKSADFVVLDANPLEDIRNTRTISGVYLRGRPVDRAGLRRRWTGGSP